MPAVESRPQVTAIGAGYGSSASQATSAAATRSSSPGIGPGLGDPPREGVRIDLERVGARVRGAERQREGLGPEIGRSYQTLTAAARPSSPMTAPYPM